MYIDIIPNEQTDNHVTKLKSIIGTATQYLIKHSSLINKQEIALLEKSMVPFTPSNSYDLANLSLAYNKTGRINIQENLLSSRVL